MNEDNLALPLRGKLADRLAQRRQEVLQRWLLLIRGDIRLMTPELLPKPLLEDYIPEFLEQFAAVLRSGDPVEDQPPEQAAQIHGTERFHEGYSIRELLLELYWLRTVLFQEALEFAQQREDDLSAYTGACRVMDRYLMEFQYRSLTVFVEELQKTSSKSTAMPGDREAA